ncbi:hypothetical protein ACGFN1_21410 [Streptomyces sp. NPDC048685]|uniref:hypothetical protein n=1 Tax=Streptomyces sp. NPDC048685 TaxID=3365584 RepID=UPI00372019DA
MIPLWHEIAPSLGALRAARAAWHRCHTPPPSPTTLVLAHWAYDGTGLTPDLERLAALYDLLRTRRLASLTIGRARRIPAHALDDHVQRHLEEAAR